MKLLLFLIPALACADPVFTLKPKADKLHSPAVTEGSGLAVSPTDKNFMWVVNDSGGTNEIHLFNTDGTSRGSVPISGANNTDWEDMASFTLNGQSYLLIADIGDNSANREDLILYIVREPKLPAEGKSLSGKIPIAWEIHFGFEGGPRDCESIAVDEKAGKIILVTKRDTIPQVHELQLHPKEKNRLTTHLIGSTHVVAPNLSFIPYRNQPTGMDIRADGTMASIVT